MSYRNKDLGIVEKRELDHYSFDIVNIKRNDLCLWILTFWKNDTIPQ